MDISADGDRCSNRDSVGLFREYSGSSFGDQFDLFFSDGFEGAEVVDNGVYLCLVTHILNYINLQNK